MVASRATAAGIPCFRASAAVCAPMQAPTMREKSASSPTEATNPLTVEALVKVTIPAAPDSTAARSSSERGFSYTVR